MFRCSNEGTTRVPEVQKKSNVMYTYTHMHIHTHIYIY
jgi:hypothetical protein